MQDNINHEQQLADKGWQSMAALLDREMPRKRRRRGLMLWVLFGLLLLSVGVYGVQSQRHAAQDNARPAPVQEHLQIPVSTSTTAENADPLASVAQQVTEDSRAADFISDDTETSREPIPNSNTTLQTRQRQSSVIHLQSQTQTAIQPAQSAALASREQLEESVPASMPALASEVRDVTQDERPAEQDPFLDLSSGQSVLPETSTVSPGLRSPVPTTGLHAREMSLSYTPSSPLGAGLVLPARTAKFLAVDAMAAVHTSTAGTPLYELEAGALLTLRADRRLRIRTGVTYGYNTIDGVGNLGSANKDAELVVDYDPNNPYPTLPGSYDVEDFLNGTYDYSEADALAETFHYLHLPVMIEYRLSKRLAVSAGARTAFLLAAPARYDASSERFQNSTTSQPMSGRSFLYDYDVVRKFDIAPLAGLSWKAGGRVWIDATYLHGLVPYINRNQVPDREDYHRTISLGMRYQLN